MSNFLASKNALECWNTRLRREHNTEISKELESADWSEAYKMDAAHMYKLTNGKFAVISERGCSCYSYDDASILVVENKKEAKDLYNSYLKK